MLFSFVIFSRYVKTCTETDDSEGSLRCCKEHGINGNGPNGIHEEGSPSKTGMSKFVQYFCVQFETDFNSVLPILPHISLLNCFR